MISEAEINRECWKKAVQKFTSAIEGKTVEEAGVSLDMLRNEALYVLGIDAANAKRILRWTEEDIANHFTVLMVRVNDIMLASQELAKRGECDRIKLAKEQ